VVAARTSADTPITIVQTLVPKSAVLSMICWIVAAPLSPSSAWNCCTTDACAASRPKTRPATAMAMMSRGASENAV